MKGLLKSLLAAACVLHLSLSSCSSDSPDVEQPVSTKTYEVVPYVWSDGVTLPDPTLITGLTYIGNEFNSNRDGFVIRNEARFDKLLELKKVNPDLKVFFCVGGTCKDGFSSLAANPAKRESFANQCARLIKERGVDGIDLDWEFPGWSGGTSADEDNFVLLLKAIREKIGSDKRLTIAVGNNVDGIKVKECLEIVDYFNVMTYDMCAGATHHTSLYRSYRSGYTTVDETIKKILAKGATYDKMMLGLAFYGRGNNVEFKDWTDYRDIKLRDGMKERWDDTALVPYILNSKDEYVIGYDNPRSLEIKCDYLKEKGFRGAMMWRTECDDAEMTLAHTVARCLLNK